MLLWTSFCRQRLTAYEGSKPDQARFRNQRWSPKPTGKQARHDETIATTRSNFIEAFDPSREPLHAE